MEGVNSYVIPHPMESDSIGFDDEAGELLKWPVRGVITWRPLWKQKCKGTCFSDRDILLNLINPPQNIRSIDPEVDRTRKRHIFRVFDRREPWHWLRKLPTGRLSTQAR